MIDAFEVLEEELMERFSALAAQTAAGKIDWELAEYLPIGFLLANPYEPESSDLILQTFTATAVLNGEDITVSIIETISVPSGKGDYYIELETDDFKKEWGLSFDEDYDSCPVEKILEKYGESPAVALTNTLIPYLAEHCGKEIKEALLGNRFFNETGIPKKTLGLPIVRKAERLCKQDDFMAFHKMVLDTSKRS